ncbi:hypothetical protein T4D_16677 [Trichinella pseudospiralis]|uniref:Uncharacterized protein n=1 Tax=Trichinella pseudospiralis TaxID=6337 RepID=A0A0V1G4A7_TRIPS|nr:hypothetical protein T4D_16677 [Trichinella pseudospiralis]
MVKRTLDKCPFPLSAQDFGLTEFPVVNYKISAHLDKRATCKSASFCCDSRDLLFAIYSP